MVDTPRNLPPPPAEERPEIEFEDPPHFLVEWKGMAMSPQFAKGLQDAKRAEFVEPVREAVTGSGKITVIGLLFIVLLMFIGSALKLEKEPFAAAFIALAACVAPIGYSLGRLLSRIGKTPGDN